MIKLLRLLRGVPKKCAMLLVGLICNFLDPSYHPTVQFAEDNVSFSINTGAPTLTGAGLETEIDLVKIWGLSETHLTKAVFNAARNAFLEDKKKKELQKDLRKVCKLKNSSCPRLIQY